MLVREGPPPAQDAREMGWAAVPSPESPAEREADEDGAGAPFWGTYAPSPGIGRRADAGQWTPGTLDVREDPWQPPMRAAPAIKKLRLLFSMMSLSTGQRNGVEYL